MYVLLKWAFFPLIFIYLMITQYIGKRKQMFRKYVRNIVLNLLTNMCSRYIINSARNTCSQTTVLKNDGGVQDEHKKNILGRIEGN